MIRVLVVEDDPLLAAGHAEKVAAVPGFEVVAAVHSGREALAAVGAAGADTPIDLVLLDMTLPDVDGLQVLRALRAAAVPADVIAVTAAREPATVRQALSMGVVQYLLKPFSAAALEERLRAYARFRADVAAASGEHGIDQQAIDEALSQLRTAAPGRGVAAPTLQAVVAALRTAPSSQGLSAAEVAAATGLSRVSARRYLEHLSAAGRVRREPRYGGSGRPELAYLPTPAL
ncbi:response regulator of citrate/malate metabolism [Kineococcus radiotolerans]|uniref:Transcriptional regulatory protein n=2 Tax=Kineococcus radiotolerans TaxID=131568 RepID=A6W5B7_KINRD|nr:response regulator [Kineococcus radiotolerans]ABS02006.1 two component transcriptional regulator, Fis family [Kineococcus radiotolerans SRS30216 = ATCC BAA-149]MBB2900844.1 response regulator of citrate/malate metabolism [Kineococcus radiotolerans]